MAEKLGLDYLSGALRGESLLLDPMFEIPGSDVMSVHITEDVVYNKSGPVYIRGKAVSEDEDQTIEVQARANAK
uniref:Uncharacterized protein n=1 Tax=Timema genevievae TaxID=629358 RepID=A0A7R9PL54_TIMGE|nr:unnamed protein product [Timema genevievae]